MSRRNTPSKTLILDLLKGSGTALSQDRIETEVKGFMDRVTIYRVLNRFCEDGITHKIMADDGKYYFALCHGCGEKHEHNHFHFRCTVCQKVECMEQKIMVSMPRGYKPQSLSGWVNGLCGSCAETE
jgi:Fur family transcriptional regulator, ferric uptake regulator